MHSFINAIKQAGQKLKKRLGPRFLTYLVFLFIAVIIWYLNSLNKDYTTSLNFKVRFVNFPEDKILVSTPPKKLAFTVSASGYTILKYRLGLIFSPINIDASYQDLKKRKGKPEDYYITAQSIFDRVSQELASGIILRNIAPDTIKFVLSEMIRKEVPVKVQANMQFETQYSPKGNMRVTPGKVVVSGPKAIVDTLQSVYTVAKTFKKLDDTLYADLKLRPIHLLQYSAETISIVQPIERHTEASVTVPIEIINLSDSLKMKTFPSTVTVNCLVAVSDFEKIQPYLFRVVVDYATVKGNNPAKIKVMLLKAPEYVSDVKLYPRSVEYIVER